MVVQELPGDTLYRIIIPYYGKDRKKIPTQLRNAIIKLIERRFTDSNGGSRSYDGRGSWESEKYGYITEPITIIESHGKNPFTVAEIQEIRKQLNQEAIMFEKVEGRYARFIGEDPEEKIPPMTIQYNDGSKLVYSRHTDPNNPDDKGILLVEHYDSSGNITERYNLKMTEDIEEEYIIYSHMPVEE